VHVHVAPVRKANFGNQNVHIVFGVINMRYHRHDTGDQAIFCDRFRDENSGVGVMGKVTGTTDTVHHMRSHNMGRIDVTVDVDFQRGIDRDQAKTLDNFRMIGNPLRAKQDVILVFGEISKYFTTFLV